MIEDVVKVYREKNEDVVINDVPHNHQSIDEITTPKSILFKLGTPELARIAYILSGFALFVLLLLLFNTYILHLKVETAVVSAHIETIGSPVSGYITKVLVTPGAMVHKGDILAKIENMSLTRKLHLSQVLVEESKLAVQYYQQVLDNELQRLKIYQEIGRSRLRSAKSMVMLSKQHVMEAEKTLNRFTELHTKNYVSSALLDTTKAKYARAQETLKNVKTLHTLEKHSLKNALDKGMYFTGSKAEGITHELTAKLQMVRLQVILNENRVKIYERLINKLTLRAPFDGKITQVLKSTGNTTDTDHPIIFIEKLDTNKNIIAYLTQNEVIHIGASNHVKIYLPSSGKSYHGHIIEINRTEGFIDEIKAQYRWRDFQIDRSAIVTIAIEPHEQIAFNQQVFPGMPAVVYFSKNIF